MSDREWEELVLEIAAEDDCELSVGQMEWLYWGCDETQ